MRYPYSVLLYHASGAIRGRTGLYELAVFPYTFVPVKDGWAFIAGYTDPNFRALCRVMGRPELGDDPRFNTTLQRTTLVNEIQLRDEICAWSVNYTSAEILDKVLADPGPGVIVFGPMNPPTRTLTEAHWWERGCLRRLSDPIYGELLLQMPAWRMTRTPPRLKWACRPAGYHNSLILQKYFGIGPLGAADGVPDRSERRAKPLSQSVMVRTMFGGAPCSVVKAAQGGGMKDDRSRWRPRSRGSHRRLGPAGSARWNAPSSA